LTELSEVLGDRRISVSRELTKKFEETVRGRISEVKEHFGNRSIKGEFVLVVEGKAREDAEDS
jgi:16S rRNA (cytidine1402-2'-O)-methyltransferase